MATELFKLLGTIAVENDAANKAIDETTDKAGRAESRMSSAFKGIGNAALKFGKVVVTGMGMAAVAIGGLVTSAVKAYADYEQLIGGVETLFGAQGMSLEEYARSTGQTMEEAYDEYVDLIHAQDSVIKNSERAYLNAGMSCNEYMETVTGFSASLISSLGGDTVAAANIADMAIQDMADNSAKFGTDMELVKNAYMGFAKGNYTMLKGCLAA